MKYIILILSMLVITSNIMAASTSAEGAKVYIISPQNGAVLYNPITIKFGLKGMGVAPAGTDKANTGHHHLLIDITDLPSLEEPIPADQQHRHFGGGQTETALTMEPGQHTLQLLLGDKNHIAHDEPVLSEKITIFVE
jgi:hypothetical protein